MSDAYKIGVQLAITGNMSSALAQIAGQLTGLDRQTESLMAKWNKLGSNMKLAVGGAVAAGTGFAALDWLGNMVKHGEELVHVQQQLQAATQNQKDVAEATAIAWREASTYGLKVGSVLSDIKEARMVFGSTEHAMDFIEPLEKMRVVLNAMTEGRGDTAREAVYNMARAGELKGLQTPEQFVSYFDQMTKAITASGGKVDPNAFMQATQYGKIASKGWNEEFYTRILPSMIQEMRPSTAGQSLMSLYNTLVAGHMSIPAMNAAMDLGLIGDDTKVKFNKTTGQVMKIAPGALLESDMMTANPFQWAQEVMKPLVEKKLGREIAGPDDAKALDILTNIFGNRNSAAAIATLLNENKRIRKDASLIGDAQGLDASGPLLANDPKTARANFGASWDNMLTAFGSPMVAPAIAGMNAVANAMKALTAFAVAHPDLTKAMGIGTAAGGTALAVGGTAAVGTALWRTLFGGGPAQLQTAALMLQEAAVALGAKGVPGVGMAAGAAGAGKPWGSAAGALMTYLGVEYLSGKMGEFMTWLPHAKVDAHGKPYDPEANSGMGVGGYFNRLMNDLPRNEDGSIKWFDRGSLNNSFKGMHWNGRAGMTDSNPFGQAGGPGAGPPPVVNVAPPQVNTQVQVSIDGQQLKALVTSWITSAIGNLGGFSKGAPAQNTGNMMPAVDGGH